MSGLVVAGLTLGVQIFFPVTVVKSVFSFHSMLWVHNNERFYSCVIAEPFNHSALINQPCWIYPFFYCLWLLPMTLIFEFLDKYIIAP